MYQAYTPIDLLTGNIAKLHLILRWYIEELGNNIRREYGFYMLAQDKSNIPGLYTGSADAEAVFFVQFGEWIFIIDALYVLGDICT